MKAARDMFVCFLMNVGNSEKLLLINQLPLKKKVALGTGEMTAVWMGLGKSIHPLLWSIAKTLEHSWFGKDCGKLGGHWEVLTFTMILCRSGVGVCASLYDWTRGERGCLVSVPSDEHNVVLSKQELFSAFSCILIPLNVFLNLLLPPPLFILGWVLLIVLLILNFKKT